MVVAMVDSVKAKAASADSVTEARVGELLNDYLDRRARGESITENLLLTEHPEFADVLAQHLNMLRALAPPQNAIKDLLAKKMLLPSSSPEYAAELGSYRITGVLGRGGMGIVLRAIETPLNRLVALKILRPELSVDRRALIRFEHEAKAAAALRHPNIVTVYACGACDGTHFLAMELIDGLSLAEVLAREPALATDEIRRIFRQLLLGLTAAHAVGLIHRDIKSSNILLDGPCRTVKIADFGLARITASNTRITLPQAAIGTPEYMSPEQARGDEDIDHRTDLYSAGVVLYEMLTGRVPFRGESPSALVHAILHVDPPAPRTTRKNANARLSRLALRLMAKQRGHRFLDAEAVLATLDRPGRFPLWEQRRRAARRLLTGSLGIIAVLGTTMLVRSSQQATLSASSRPEIRDVRVGEARDDRVPKQILASYGDATDWKVFLDLAQDGRFRSFDDGVYSARLWREPKEREPRILAAIAGPKELRGLVAFDPLGHPLWNLEVTDRRSWPDCGSLGGWVCTDVGFLDSRFRQAVVSARDRAEYPSCVSIVDLAARRVLSSFYHLGQLKPPLVVPDYFGPDQPAIVAWGLNNKLDGFATPNEGDAVPRSNYEYVPAVMILDPNTMNGIGPPRSKRFPDLADARPYAYAFLELSGLFQNAYRAPGETEHVSVGQERTATIDRVDVHTDTLVGDPPRPALSIHTTSLRREGDDAVGGVQLLVDGDLKILSLVPTTYERVRNTKEFWDPVWHVLVRQYEEVK